MSPAPVRLAAAATLIFNLWASWLFFGDGQIRHIGHTVEIRSAAPPPQAQGYTSSESYSDSRTEEQVTRFFDRDRQLIAEVREPLVFTPAPLTTTSSAISALGPEAWIVLLAPALLWLPASLLRGPRAVALAYGGAIVLTAVGVMAGSLGVLFLMSLAFALAAGFSALLYGRLVPRHQAGHRQ